MGLQKRGHELATTQSGILGAKTSTVVRSESSRGKRRDAWAGCYCCKIKQELSLVRSMNMIITGRESHQGLSMTECRSRRGCESFAAGFSSQSTWYSHWWC